MTIEFQSAVAHELFSDSFRTISGFVWSISFQSAVAHELFSDVGTSVGCHRARRFQSAVAHELFSDEKNYGPLDECEI